MPVRHDVSYDKRLPMSVNMGKPRVLHASRFSGFRRSISRIVDDIERSSADLPTQARRVGSAAESGGAYQSMEPQEVGE